MKKITHHDRLIESRLESTLNLLHNCLLPNAAKKQILPEILINANHKDAFNKFLHIAKHYDNDKTFDPEYIKALSDLRDELLKDY